MSVRAKFKCESVNEGVVKLGAVTGDSDENKSFFKYTPSGQISLGIVNQPALEQFEVGAEYYVDFNKAS